MKVAPLYGALCAEDWCEAKLVHTGQHYDTNMSGVFFNQLGLPQPHFSLGVGSGTHAEQTGGAMMAYERVCRRSRPDWIVVVGDVNSTLACALAGAKLNIPVAHLEAGIRSFDRSMPEEVNRVVTDAVSNLLWTISQEADDNLRKEGTPPERVKRVGNIAIDAYEMARSHIAAEDMPRRLGLGSKEFAVVTLHRPANVDDPVRLRATFDCLAGIARRLPIVFPVHPRTRQNALKYDLAKVLEGSPGIHLLEPLGYIQFMSLIAQAKAVITDSGTVQDETTYLGIPCFTLRDKTDRPWTVTQGTNRLVETCELENAIVHPLLRQQRVPALPLWDGQTTRRVVLDLRARCL